MSPVTSGSHASPTVTAAVVCGTETSSGSRRRAPRRRAAHLLRDVQPLDRAARADAKLGAPRHRPESKAISSSAPSRRLIESMHRSTSRRSFRRSFSRRCSSRPRGRGSRSRAPQATPPTIVFYGFSILADVMHEGIFPAFQGSGPGRATGDVEFVSSFGGSGTVTNQVILGVPAQLALLSLESDADRLADAGVIRARQLEAAAPRRRREPDAVRHPRAARAIRSGIRDFADLARPGVRIVHPDPLTSGGANWAIVAEYGAGARGAPGGGRRRGDARRGSGRTSSPRRPRRAPRGRSSRTASATRSSRTSRKRSTTAGRGRLQGRRRLSAANDPLGAHARRRRPQRSARASGALVDAFRRSSSGARRRSGSSCGTASAACDEL